VFTLWVQLGRLRAQARFIVVKKLAAVCILGCEVIDRHVKSIHPKEKQVFLNDGTTVAILHAATHPAMGETDVECGRKPMPSTKVRIARFAKIPARSESFVVVQCDSPVTGPNNLGVVSTHSGYSSKSSSMRGVLFKTLNTFYFQQNTSPYMSHDTDTMTTHCDTRGTEIP
jgi:hypothetical protein